VVLLLVLAVGLGGLYATMPKMGYCFGTALSEAGDRLFVTAGYRGLYAFDVTPDGALTLLSTVYDGGYYRYVEVLDDVAYVANSQQGLMVLDVGQDEPVLVWTQLDSLAYGIHIQPPLAYVAAEREGLFVFDVSTPHQPEILGSVPMPGRAWDVWVEGDHAYVADVDEGLIVVDVSSPDLPQIVSSLSWDPESSSAEIIDGQDGFVYVASGEYGLLVIDANDPSNPAIVHRYDPGPDSFGEGVKVWGDTLYVSIEDSTHPGENGLHVLDIQDPSSPTLVLRLAISDFVEDVSVGGARLAIANTQSGVVLYDIQVPQRPHWIATYPSPFWRVFTRHLRW
jgi:hypothetical protein